MTAKEKAKELLGNFGKELSLKVIQEILSINNERMYQLSGLKETFYKEVRLEIINYK